MEFHSNFTQSHLFCKNKTICNRISYQNNGWQLHVGNRNEIWYYIYGTFYFEFPKCHYIMSILNSQ